MVVVQRHPIGAKFHLSADPDHNTISLLQLVHPHLLQHLLADNPEYDQNLFNANVHSLRDDTKSMISWWAK